MSDEGLRPIIVKRIKKTAGGHHGGAWKIAYADFVTAMMAFFLLMWLLGSTSKGDLNGISEFFQTPLKVALAGGSGSGDSSSIVQGGGQDLSRRNGQVKRGSNAPDKKNYDLKAAKAALEALEADRLKTLKAKLEATIDANPLLKKYKNQLLLDITSEGLRIQIVDELNRPMFNLAKAELQPYTRDILHVIGIVLNEVPNRIGLSGHTDSTPYMSDTGYSNWELSADRANASRRELVIGGMSDAKILRVVGLAAAAPLDRQDPFSAANRRISIIVMNKRTEEAVMRDGASLEVPEQPGVATPAAAGKTAVPAAAPKAAP
ncbi:flagellar motor protein MotB [Massilia antarctica]|uniref:Flagellar motor protein MotB n=1 Tax=Massilia antarctica TaxID=2765360 RepID=A0AA48W9S6_9BURK|nr:MULTISPECIES: flagellar motor protein MotB [Massilia]MCY0914050.1 flagellar motor protein MotB [Massilia sp. H27-R4]QPI47497.1 flagellar motor protein MotB [Massilia antarctica]CUI08445.1 Flagellar motor rotation protein MotB [Janthinobacterium sp. CG23_2]CUU32231.1 Flagellar motor rotation protein MotB [Janthinobacterium sp. CG23_2]